MKMTKWITLGALIGSCSFAVAQDAAPKPERKPREVPAEMLKKWDKDGDGKISPEEAKAMREAMQAERLKKWDKNGDGKIDADEEKAMREEMTAKRKALMEKYDENKDGKLDPAERKKAMDAGEDMSALMGGGRGMGGAEGRTPGQRGGKRGKAGADGNGGGKEAPPGAPGK